MYRVGVHMCCPDNTGGILLLALSPIDDSSTLISTSFALRFLLMKVQPMGFLGHQACVPQFVWHVLFLFFFNGNFWSALLENKRSSCTQVHARTSVFTL
jgi:hypothetical protein